MDKVHKPSDTECYTLSSEPFRFYLLRRLLDQADQDVHITWPYFGYLSWLDSRLNKPTSVLLHFYRTVMEFEERHVG
jgi:hypothetical protein